MLYVLIGWLAWSLQPLWVELVNGLVGLAHSSVWPVAIVWVALVVHKTVELCVKYKTEYEPARQCCR